MHSSPSWIEYWQMGSSPAHRSDVLFTLVIVPGTVAGRLGEAIHLHDEEAVVHHVQHHLGGAGGGAAGQHPQLAQPSFRPRITSRWMDWSSTGTAAMVSQGIRDRSR